MGFSIVNADSHILGEVRVFSADKSATVNKTYGRMRNISLDDDIKAVCEMLAKLRLIVEDDDGLRNEVRLEVSENDVERWSDVESDSNVLEALCSDIVDELQDENDGECSDKDVAHAEIENTDEEQEVRRLLIRLL